MGLLVEDEEEWRVVPEFEDYLVSNLGRIMSIKHNKRYIISLSMGRGYWNVTFWMNNKSKLFGVHRIVAKAFIPNPENKREVNHIDGNKINNHVSNLEWNTSKENKQHAVKMQLVAYGSQKPSSKLKESDIPIIRKLHLIDKVSQNQIARDYKVSVFTIHSIFKGKTWRRS